MDTIQDPKPIAPPLPFFFFWFPMWAGSVEESNAPFLPSFLPSLLQKSRDDMALWMLSEVKSIIFFPLG